MGFLKDFINEFKREMKMSYNIKTKPKSKLELNSELTDISKREKQELLDSNNKINNIKDTCEDNKQNEAEEFEYEEVKTEQVKTEEQKVYEYVKSEIKHGRNMVQIRCMSLQMFTKLLEPNKNCSKYMFDSFLIEMNKTSDEYISKMKYFSESLDIIENMLKDVNMKDDDVINILYDIYDMACDLTDEIRDYKIFKDMDEIKKYNYVAYTLRKPF